MQVRAFQRASSPGADGSRPVRHHRRPRHLSTDVLARVITSSPSSGVKRPFRSRPRDDARSPTIRGAKIMRERFSLGRRSGVPAVRQPSGPAGSFCVSVRQSVPPSPDEAASSSTRRSSIQVRRRRAKRSRSRPASSEEYRFSLTPVKPRVSGFLIGPDGPAPNMGVRLTSATEDTLTELEASVTMTGAGGEFTLTGVPPGQYTIKVLRVPRPAVPDAVHHEHDADPDGVDDGDDELGGREFCLDAAGRPGRSDNVRRSRGQRRESRRHRSDRHASAGARHRRFEFDGTRERPCRRPDARARHAGARRCRAPASFNQIIGTRG